MKNLLKTGLVTFSTLLGASFISTSVLSISAFAQTFQTAQEAFDAKAWQKAAKLARSEALDGNAYCLPNFIILDRAFPKMVHLRSCGTR